MLEENQSANPVRARNIKPAVFKNEILGCADPALTILFAGLWCVADREGRLQDRPLRIKAEVFPYREIDIEASLNWLHEHKFIVRYTTKAGAVIQVSEFKKHQRPHMNEPKSELLDINQRVKVSKTSTNGSKRLLPKEAALRSDCLMLNADLLIPDLLIPEREMRERASAPVEDISLVRVSIDKLKAIYPKGGRQDWISAEKYARQLVIEQHATWAQIEQGVERYAQYCVATATYTMNPAKFFRDVDRPWAQDWHVQVKAPRKTKYEQLMERRRNGSN